MRVLLEKRNSERWTRAVEFAKKRYCKSYGANINPSPDYYLIVENDDNNILSCAGVCFATEQKLFSENYLEEPCHTLISKLERRTVDRSSVAEIGSVASVHPIAGRTLFEMLSIVAWCMGANYLICTSNPRSIKVMSQCNVLFVPICKANINHAPKKTGVEWGSYYQSEPTTGYINLRNMQNHYREMVLKTVFKHPSLSIGS